MMSLKHAAYRILLEWLFQDIPFHSDTDVLANLSKRSDVQSGDFILLILLAYIKHLLNVSSALSLFEPLNQWEWMNMPQRILKEAISSLEEIEW